MSKLHTLLKQPARLVTVSLVLAGAVTMAGACSSGDVTADATRQQEEVAIATQGLGWTGGCACVPTTSCASTTGCFRSATLKECPLLLRCATGTIACYVEPDETSCTTVGGGKSLCDGGYCGRCPGCYASSGLCFPGTTVAMCGPAGEKCQSCNDGNECTTDACGKEGTCTHTKLEDKAACTGGACYGGTCCTGCVTNGSCQAGTEIKACGAAAGECKACDIPSNKCLRATCISGACGTEYVPQGNSCTDNDVCNGEETCDGAGNCLKGTPKDCTSSDPCFKASCNASLGCVLTVNVGAQCSDGDACTMGDACDASGKCTPTGRKQCVDGSTCTDDTCDPATGNCLYPPVANNTPCDDGAACTNGETCQNGTCTTATVVCDDKNFCTQDTIKCPEGTCSLDPVPMNGRPCVPNDKCFYTGTCSAGTCVGSSAVNCDDGNPCTKDSCAPETGCVHQPEALTTECIDGNPCTTDDRCRITGKCAGTPIVCAAIDDCHLPGVCNERTGTCGDDPLRDDGSPCAHGAGTCVSGTCRTNTGTAGAAGAAGAPSESAGAAGEAGAPAGGTGGVVAAAGGSAATEGGTESGGDSAAGGKSAKGGSVNKDDVYQRDPGGCSCSLPHRSSASGLAWMGLLGLALGMKRRRRSTRSIGSR